MIVVNNMFWFTLDTFKYWGDVNFARMKPRMYDNWFSSLLLGNPFGIFTWYDMFSLQGYGNWLADSLSLQLLFPWELYQAFIRQGRNDWTYNTVEKTNPIDKNRLFKDWQWADPYDYDYWSTQQNGVDCNGNVAYGNYCFCPSQGYNCQCQPNDWYSQGQVRNLCNDHYGYDCNGNYVDGETNWCNDQMNIYWVLNQKS